MFRARALPLACVAALLSLASTACFFIDDEPTATAARGYTYCGEFANEEVWCHPGQYCDDPVFTECRIGCLSDVNCASNQFCDITAPNEPGTCRNNATIEHGLTADTGLGGDAGIGGADAGAPR